MSTFEPVLAALDASGGRYVVVGGLATVLHGYARFTADVDLVVDFAPESLERILDALDALGLEPRLPLDPRELMDAECRRHWVRDKGMRVFSFWNPDNPLGDVDLFVEHPLEFEGLYQRARRVEVGGFTTPIASIEDLIELKRLAGRPQDVADIAELERILAYRPA